MHIYSYYSFISGNVKKKPPPRPPPPDFSKIKSKSAWQLNQNLDNLSLIEWSPTNSPTTTRPSGGSLYSSFSSSTSSLASSKRSSEYESLPFSVTNNLVQIDHQTSKNANMPVFNLTWSAKIQEQVAAKQNEKLSSASQAIMPTIIRPHLKNSSKSRMGAAATTGNASPPMPMGPPPSPPKEIKYESVPCAIALHDFPASQPGDLPLETNDIVCLIRRVNKDWLYGRVGDREGIFPENFVEIQIPLVEEEDTVIALFEFRPQMPGDLALIPGEKVKVLKIISNNWLLGELNGKIGQFPSNFVDRIPKI